MSDRTASGVSICCWAHFPLQDSRLLSARTRQLEEYGLVSKSLSQSVSDRPYHPWTVLWAVNTAAAVVARADGGIDPAERLRLSEYLQSCGFDSHMSPLGRGLFDKCVRELHREPGNERTALARVLAGFDGTPWAWIILRAAEHVAAADGAMHRAEIRALETIRTILDLPHGVPERYAACGLWPARA
jgi:tellurite resistance protein